MFSECELAVVRRAYAKQILAAARVKGDPLEAAFAHVCREHFLGPGPWPILVYEKYVLTPNADPVCLYTKPMTKKVVSGVGVPAVMARTAWGQLEPCAGPERRSAVEA